MIKRISSILPIAHNNIFASHMKPFALGPMKILMRNQDNPTAKADYLTSCTFLLSVRWWPLESVALDQMDLEQIQRNNCSVLVFKHVWNPGPTEISGRFVYQFQQNHNITLCSWDLTLPYHCFSPRLREGYGTENQKVNRLQNLFMGTNATELWELLNHWAEKNAICFPSFCHSSSPKLIFKINILFIS